MYPHGFPLHWIKGTYRIFYTLHYFVGLMKNGTWGTLRLEIVGERTYGEGGDFLVGEDTPKDTMLIKQVRFYI